MLEKENTKFRDKLADLKLEPDARFETDLYKLENDKSETESEYDSD